MTWGEIVFWQYLCLHFRTWLYFYQEMYWYPLYEVSEKHSDNKQNL
jgi:hypothetical protein